MRFRVPRSAGLSLAATAVTLVGATTAEAIVVSGPNNCSNQRTYSWMGDAHAADVTIPSLGRPNGIGSYVGTMLRPADTAAYAGPRPLVVLQHGLGGNRCGLWWAAQDLAGHGYVTLVWTAPQGTSTTNSFFNAVDATRSAIAFSRTTSNPFAAITDGDRVAIGGHSLGAVVASFLQGEADPGVQAAVAFDSLRRWGTGDPAGAVNECGGEPVLEASPRVPALGFAMDLPCASRPDFDPPDLKHAGYLHWRANEVPSMSLVMAGFDHGDFSAGGTEAQWHDLAHFTRAWLDRWLGEDASAVDRLLANEVNGQPTTALLSTRFLSGAYLPPRVDSADYLALRSDVTEPRMKRLDGPDGRISRERVRVRGLRFAFSSAEKGVGFECRLDEARFRACRSPKRYRRAALGRHLFRVRAVDPSENRSGPKSLSFRITP